MLNYEEFHKELVSNKHKLEQISAAFLNDESFALIQNKVPPKHGDPGSFLILCNFNKAFSCNALADLDFVILKMEEDSKVPLILGRPFLHIVNAVIRVKQKQLNLGVGTEQEEVDLEDISQIQDVVLREKLLSITRLISNIESLNDNSTPDRVLNSFESDNSLLDNFSPEFQTFCDHSKETRSGNTTHANYSVPEYDSFCFEIEPDQERLINLMRTDVPDNSSNDPLLEEVDLFLSDDSIPPGIENVADDPEGDIRFLEELLISDSIISHESSDSNFEDNPSILLPPPEPPDDNFDLEPEVISAVMENIDEPDEHFNPGREINVSTKIEDDDYALDSKLLLINSICQRLDKKEQEVKKILKQPTEHGNRSIQSLQNFRVVHKSFISLNNSSQISSIHSVAPIQSTKKPEHLLSMGYEHLSITPETESDAENLLPIPSKCKDNDDLDSSDDKSLPDEDVPAEEFKIYLNPLFDEEEINSDKLDPHCFNVESNFVESLLNRDTFIGFSSKFDFSYELAHIKPEIPKSDFDFEEEICLIENLLYDNSFPRPPEELNAEIADTIVESIPLLPIPVWNGDAQQEEIDIVTSLDDVLPPSVENDDDSSDDPLLGEAYLFLSDNSIPPGIENFADGPKGDIRFMEELLIDDSILSHELSDSNFKDNPKIPRPPPEPPDAETDVGEEI
nr:hypothetical protein [Tanacetum cinerariifolium]